MKASATTLLQQKLGEYTYLYNLSYYVPETHSEVQVGTIIVNLKTGDIKEKLDISRLPSFITKDKLKELRAACHNHALDLDKFII